MLVCSECGQENPEGSQFCNACGAPLAADMAAPQQTRKTVTVLFCDLVDSTPLGEQLDPEALQGIKSRYFDEVRSVLERHGGTVEKFIGDAVMAVFGIPTVHEDDALRAVRAALEMRQELARLNADFERERGVRIATRTGVNTGEVVAGDPSHREGFATGDAVNLAARLEQAAQPGEIMIGEQTFRLVRDAATAERVDGLSLKGKADLVTAYRLLEVRPGAPGTARRLDSPLVGRENELSLLRQTFERVKRERTCYLFTLLGPAGVGKSRLVDEFARSASGEATVLRGRCLPYGEGITFWPVAEAVREAVDVSGEDVPAGEVRERIKLLVEGEGEGEVDAELVADRVGEIIGVSEAPAPREELFWGVRRLFEALARRSPVVVLFDDVHWGEPTFLDLVEYIADWSRDAPLLLLCIARPELLDARRGWGGDKFNATSLLLEPLLDEESGHLIENLLGRAELPEQVRRQIIGAAEGNPLFVEEMLAMLIDDGRLRRDNGSCREVEDVSEIAVPPTIQALLAARLDHLPRAERAVVERASIEGKLFHRGAVVELLPADLRPGVSALLMALVRKELVRPERAAFSGEDAFRFRHLLIRDAAYESLPKQARAVLHEQFARWLDTRVGDRAAEYGEIIGYHLEQAFRYQTELGSGTGTDSELAVRAAEKLAGAGRRAFRRGDAAAAVNLLERVTSLLPERHPLRLEMLPRLAVAYDIHGERENLERTVDEAKRLARAAGDRRIEWRAIVIAMVAELDRSTSALHDEFLKEAERAIDVFTELGDEIGLTLAWRLIGVLHFYSGQAAHGVQALRRSLEHARAGGLDGALEESFSIAWLTSALMYGPMPANEVIRTCAQILESAAGHQAVEGIVLRAVAWCQAMQGNFDEAREALARRRSIAEALGQRRSLASSAFFEGPIHVLAGDLESAERAYRASIAELEQIGGHTAFVSTLAGELAQCLYGRGQYDEADRLAEKSKREAAPDDFSSQLVWRSVRAKVLAREGRADDAEALARQAVELGRQSDYLNAHADALMDLAEVLALARRSADAADAVADALRLFEQKGNLVAAERARARLNELRG